MSNTSEKPVLVVDNIYVHIGERAILQDVSFSVNQGEIVGVIGPNGCGKTTLLNAISGFLPVTDGTISVNGTSITEMPAYKRAAMGIARGFQHVGVFREMTVSENIIMAIERSQDYPWWWMFSSLRRKKMSSTVDVSLEGVGLLAHKKSHAGVLSGGQLRLLELARLKLLTGNLLLIDEPTAGVAPALRNELGTMIKGLSKDNRRTVVIVEHDLKFLFNIADRIIVLVDGHKYLEGTPEQVRGDKRLQEIYFGE